MKLKISSFADVGVIEKERVVLKASVALDIGNFVVMQTAVSSGSDKVPTTDIHHTFWFPDKEISAGDLVVLYTKSGKQSDKAISDGANKAHFFYWELQHAIWNVKDRVLVVLHTPEWEYLMPE